jgi:mannose-6-phosphate isomerase-like protein (cupin superfamily)
MKHISTSGLRKLFSVLESTRSSQVALMILPPGESTGPPDNEHPQSEQWLFVISGTGLVRADRRRVSLRQHSLVLIEKNEIHQVVNTGRRPLRTLNLYVPLAYTDSGEAKRK